MSNLKVGCAGRVGSRRPLVKQPLGGSLIARKELQMSEYVPFGDEWKAEVMRLKKSEIVDMLAKALREQTSRPTMRALDETDLCDCANTRMSLVVGGICQVCQKPFRQ